MFLTISIWITFLVLCVGVVLQIWLSGLDSRWPGLVLPFLTFLWAVVRIFMVRFYGLTAIQMAGMYLGNFLLKNISTLILLAVYFARRAGKRKNKMLDKMNIHDLH